MVIIKEAKTRKELVKFMEFPLELYKDSPYYVPDILSSQVADMERDRNPAFEYCDARCFLAYRDGKIVGRIAGILNERANAKFQKKYLNIYHIDFIDDNEVVDALFDAVEGWARELGCTATHGPLGFTDMDREGMLVEGFDKKSLFYTFYNHPYYVTQMERRGYEKEVDWVEYRVNLPAEPDPQIAKVAQRLKEKRNLKVVSLGDRPIKGIIRDVFNLWNDTYQVLFGVVPLTEKQVEKYVEEFLPMVDKRTTTFVYDAQDQLVAFGICCPALDDALRACGGKLFPWGWAPVVKALKGKNDTVDMLLIAVKPELQGLGINAVVMDDMLRRVLKAGFRYGETGPMLETNNKVLSQWKRFDAVQHKRRRCWVKEL
ncbi:MAG: N-acetyltransferase [Clostridia bacterium]|nr:N-acetyltransferase [Clostridia bacterium]